MDFRPNKYLWTNHSEHKMKYYGLSQSRVRRVLHSPIRIEEGVAQNTFAAMQPVSYKTKDGVRTWSQEIWVMATNLKSKKSNSIRIISAWRYPGVSKNRMSLPDDVLNEIQEGIASLGH